MIERDAATSAGERNCSDDWRRREREARAKRRDQRNELLLNYAASIAARERAAAIIDIEGLKGFILASAGNEIFRTLTDMPADERTIAAIIRDGLAAQFERQANVFKRIAQDEFGVTADEFRQAARDYEMIAAQRKAAVKLGGAPVANDGERG